MSAIYLDRAYSAPSDHRGETARAWYVLTSARRRGSGHRVAEFKPTYCPVLPEPLPAEIAAFAQARGLEPAVAAAELFNARETAIAQMEQDPIRFAWIPPIWKVCWAILGVPWLDRDWARAVRKNLGFAAPVRTLLALGGNRSGKTQFELFTAMRVLWKFPRQRVWVFHQTHQQSVEYHQRPMWDLLPIELRGQKTIRGRREYLSWTQQMGFSNSKFVLPDRQECSFRNYSQDRTDAIEGGEIKFAAADELIPPDWLETLELRLATQAGWCVVGQTPIDGYSQLVRMFCDKAETVRTCTAFLLPKDGGPALEHAALGLAQWEYQEVVDARRDGLQHRCPPSRPQDCEAWLTGGTGEPEIPAGRVFEKMPRVMRCDDPKRAVVHLFSNDNPFGNPPEVVDLCRPRGAPFIRTRFYGLAEKTIDVKFPTFSKAAHVVKAESIPAEGTNYLFVDPCSGRNFFMAWIRATPTAHYAYREWPGHYHIPGIGTPEPWALFSTDAKRVDGARGGGQKTFGWGLAEYKKEIARLEGWKDYEERGARNAERGSEEEAKRERGSEGDEGKTEAEVVAGWDARRGAREVVAARFMDARFAQVKSFEDGGMVTLLEKFDEMGLEFFDTSQNASGAWTIGEGCQLVNDALWWDKSRPMSFGNQPKLFISDACQNLIFAMETWTGADGGEGATKDPCDVLRYYFMKGCRYEAPVTEGMMAAARGRGCY